jgi:hypothetical protein
MDGLFNQPQGLEDVWLADDMGRFAFNFSDDHLLDHVTAIGSPSDVFRQLPLFDSTEHIVAPSAVVRPDSMPAPGELEQALPPWDASAIGEWASLSV